MGSLSLTHSAVSRVFVHMYLTYEVINGLVVDVTIVLVMCQREY